MRTIFPNRCIWASPIRMMGKHVRLYWGTERKLFAPANGTNWEVIDGIFENSPGTHNPYAQIGNTIIIQHSTKNIQFLPFWKQAAFCKSGRQDNPRAVLAQCGSSECNQSHYCTIIFRIRRPANLLKESNSILRCDGE